MTKKKTKAKPDRNLKRGKRSKRPAPWRGSPDPTPEPVVPTAEPETHLLVTGRHAACFAIVGPNTRYRREVTCEVCKQTDAFLLPLPGDELTGKPDYYTGAKT